VLDGQSLLTVDLGGISSVFCIVNVSFYSSLLGTTLLLLGAVIAIFGYRYIRSHCGGRCETSWACSYSNSDADRSTANGIFATVYLLLFAYPLVAVKVVQVGRDVIDLVIDLCFFAIDRY
jgi:hypothetical protein